MTKSVSKVCQYFIVSVRFISISGAQRVPLVPATWRAHRTENCRSSWAAQPCPFKRRALVCSSSVAGNAIQSFTWSRHRPSKLADNGVPSLPGHSLTLNKFVVGSSWMHEVHSGDPGSLRSSYTPVSSPCQSFLTSLCFVSFCLPSLTQLTSVAEGLALSFGTWWAPQRPYFCLHCFSAVNICHSVSVLAIIFGRHLALCFNISAFFPASSTMPKFQRIHGSVWTAL